VEHPKSLRLSGRGGIETPTREQLAKLDRKRKKKGNNDDCKDPHDPDAQITKMKDGRTYLAHKAEHAVDHEDGGPLIHNGWEDEQRTLDSTCRKF
jgi:transposase